MIAKNGLFVQRPEVRFTKQTTSNGYHDAAGSDVLLKSADARTKDKELSCL